MRGSVRLRATAVDVAGVLVWQVDTQFTAADVVIDAATLDPALTTPCPQIAVALRDRILKELSLMAKEETDTRQSGTPKRFYIDSFEPAYSLPATLSDRAFFVRLGSQLSRSVNREPALGLNPTPPAGFTKPTRAGETFAEHNWTQWTFELNPMGFAVVDYGIWLRTKKAAINDDNNETNTLVQKTMAQIADDLGIGDLAASEKAVSVTLTYAPQDLIKPGGGARVEADVVRVLEKAAFRTFLILREAKMQKCQFRDADLDAKVIQGISVLFSAYGDDLNTASSLSDENVEIFGVSGLQLLDDVKLEVTPEADAQGNQTPNDRDEAIEALLNEKYKPRLLAQPDQIITDDILEKDSRQLYLIRSVSEPPTHSFADGVLTYELKRRREIVSLSLTGTGSFSPEQKLHGSLAFSGDNLLRWNEAMALSLGGGNEFQKGQFDFSIPRETPKVRRRVPIIFAGFSLNGSYLYDESQRLGNLPSTQLSNRESQISTKVSFEYDSFTDRDYVQQAEGIDDKRKRLHHTIITDVGFDLQNTNLKSRGLVPLEPFDGRILYPSLRFHYLGSYDLKRAERRGGFGQIDFLFEAKGEKGLDTLGADFAYRQYELSAGAQVFFGFTSPNNMFLRYVRGAGASSSGTPLFKAFRLGGSLNVRGLEEGEFVGNSYSYDRSELGVGLLPLISTIRHVLPFGKKSDERSSEDTGPKQFGGIDLANTYVKVFYDRGRIFDTAALGAILNPAHGVKGYGIAAELRGLAFIANKRANLTIGYARSPDSLLHRRGIIVTGLSLDF
ncbi:MAG TPA: hypothetical protein VFT02_02660 [Pyrinomonadaceae bacterium]|nr:hypothetical protein [Pyrinomonadaceae bacterium]